MSTQTTAPDTKKQNQTTAGSYFVSNYPPFSVWSTDHIPKYFDALEQAPHPERDLGVYLHIPFCRKRCHFCYFKVYTDKNAQEIRRYINAVKSEMSLYADKPVLGGRKPSFVYFGGGTPSFLSPKQLHELVDGLNDYLSWDEAQEVTFECEPGTLNENKLNAIREIGVTRLSLGIENFDDHILEINNRAHRSPEIMRAYEYAQSIGFPQVNIDLIAGMIGETEENWQRCVQKTIEMNPECVTIYQMEIPYNTTIYQDMMKKEGKDVAPVADWDTKRRWVTEAFNELERNGYTVTSAYTAVKDNQSTQFFYRDKLWRGADLLALGVSSFGHLNGVHYQNEKDYPPYTDRIEKGEIPIRRAHKLRDEERLIREFVLQQKVGRVSRKYFQDKFDIDIYDRFGEHLRNLESQGLLRLDEDAIVWTREGLLKVDQYLWDFFLPEHNTVRYT
mgnify:CR=1 FL=1